MFYASGYKAPTTVLHYITDYICNPQKQLYIPPKEVQFFRRKAYSLAIPLLLVFKLCLFFKEVHSHGSQFAEFNTAFNSVLSSLASRNLGINKFSTYDYTLHMQEQERILLKKHTSSVQESFRCIQGDLFRTLALCNRLLDDTIFPMGNDIIMQLCIMLKA